MGALSPRTMQLFTVALPPARPPLPSAAAFRLPKLHRGGDGPGPHASASLECGYTGGQDLVIRVLISSNVSIDWRLRWGERVGTFSQSFLNAVAKDYVIF